ncbi:hypothetical protein GFK26_18035 [Variovorax paradoxus]|uniref:Uncharacterized protein n=1 Tax=Variovorax paradoxus TaxID=34073 RepID=A0A5Q0M4X1_VARPD|nr:hypothetical protein [Variovorax paradoxus]QFZ84529.1 hypothetical protein GFK26_18035 [Variovorax paradoxus]
MKAYEIVNDERVDYAETLALAKAKAVDLTEIVYLPGVRVYEVEIKTDKAAVIGLLNQEHKLPATGLIVRTGREWRVTNRGGLKEHISG